MTNNLSVCSLISAASVINTVERTCPKIVQIYGATSSRRGLGSTTMLFEETLVGSMADSPRLSSSQADMGFRLKHVFETGRGHSGMLTFG